MKKKRVGLLGFGKTGKLVANEYLTDEEREDNDQILLCCSRAKTPRLVIESFEYVKLK